MIGNRRPRNGAWTGVCSPHPRRNDINSPDPAATPQSITVSTSVPPPAAMIN